MINLKSPADIEGMRRSGAIVRDLLLEIEEKIKPGITTKKLDEFVYEFIKKRGAVPSFLGYGGYPASVCASIDEVVVHGIPSGRRLEEGNIIGIDVGAILNGWHSDAARTFTVGAVSDEKKRLIQTAKESFFAGVEQFKDGGRLGDISNAIQRYTEERGFSVVRAMVGHGIGRKMHEDPAVPNYGLPGRGTKLEKGMVLAIEPMINIGGWEVETLSDGWTCVTKDKSASAHYENTVALTENGAEILTL